VVQVDIGLGWLLTASPHVKLFTPDSSWAWYVVEYDPERRLCLGLVRSPLELTHGDFFLDQLEGIRGPHGMAIERDTHWQPRSLTQCQQEAVEDSSAARLIGQAK
jgi:hypothetical protein